MDVECAAGPSYSSPQETEATTACCTETTCPASKGGFQRAYPSDCTTPIRTAVSGSERRAEPRRFYDAR